MSQHASVWLSARLSFVREKTSWVAPGGKCPTVPKTFLNEHSCKLLPGCLALGQQGAENGQTSGKGNAGYTVIHPTSVHYHQKSSSSSTTTGLGHVRTRSKSTVGVVGVVGISLPGALQIKQGLYDENSAHNQTPSGISGDDRGCFVIGFHGAPSFVLFFCCQTVNCTRPGLTVSLTLDTLAKFFSVGGRYVYVVSGLRTTASPCGKVEGLKSKMRSERKRVRDTDRDRDRDKERWQDFEISWHGTFPYRYQSHSRSLVTK